MEEIDTVITLNKIDVIKRKSLSANKSKEVYDKYSLNTPNTKHPIKKQKALSLYYQIKNSPFKEKRTDHTKKKKESLGLSPLKNINEEEKAENKRKIFRKINHKKLKTHYQLENNFNLLNFNIDRLLTNYKQYEEDDNNNYNTYGYNIWNTDTNNDYDYITYTNSNDKGNNTTSNIINNNTNINTIKKTSTGESSTIKTQPNDQIIQVNNPINTQSQDTNINQNINNTDNQNNNIEQQQSNQDNIELIISDLECEIIQDDTSNENNQPINKDQDNNNTNSINNKYNTLIELTKSARSQNSFIKINNKLKSSLEIENNMDKKTQSYLMALGGGLEQIEDSKQNYEVDSVIEEEEDNITDLDEKKNKKFIHHQSINSNIINVNIKTVSQLPTHKASKSVPQFLDIGLIIENIKEKMQIEDDIKNKKMRDIKQNLIDKFKDDQDKEMDDDICNNDICDSGEGNVDSININYGSNYGSNNSACINEINSEGEREDYEGEEEGEEEVDNNNINKCEEEDNEEIEEGEDKYEYEDVDNGSFCSVHISHNSIIDNENENKEGINEEEEDEEYIGSLEQQLTSQMDNNDLFFGTCSNNNDNNNINICSNTYSVNPCSIVEKNINTNTNTNTNITNKSINFSNGVPIQNNLTSNNNTNNIINTNTNTSQKINHKYSQSNSLIPKVNNITTKNRYFHKYSKSNNLTNTKITSIIPSSVINLKSTINFNSKHNLKQPPRHVNINSFNSLNSLNKNKINNYHDLLKNKDNKRLSYELSSSKKIENVVDSAFKCGTGIKNNNLNKKNKANTNNGVLNKPTHSKMVKSNGNLRYLINTPKNAYHRKVNSYNINHNNKYAFTNTFNYNSNHLSNLKLPSNTDKNNKGKSSSLLMHEFRKKLLLSKGKAQSLFLKKINTNNLNINSPKNIEITDTYINNKINLFCGSNTNTNTKHNTTNTNTSNLLKFHSKKNSINTITSKKPSLNLNLNSPIKKPFHKHCLTFNNNNINKNIKPKKLIVSHTPTHSSINNQPPITNSCFSPILQPSKLIKINTNSDIALSFPLSVRNINSCNRKTIIDSIKILKFPFNPTPQNEQQKTVIDVINKNKNINNFCLLIQKNNNQNFKRNANLYDFKALYEMNIKNNNLNKIFTMNNCGNNIPDIIEFKDIKIFYKFDKIKNQFLPFINGECKHLSSNIHAVFLCVKNSNNH